MGRSFPTRKEREATAPTMGTVHRRERVERIPIGTMADRKFSADHMTAHFIEPITGCFVLPANFPERHTRDGVFRAANRPNSGILTDRGCDIRSSSGLYAGIS